MSNFVKHWASTDKISNLDIQWHVPSDPEIDFALQLIDEFLKSSISQLRELVSSHDGNISSGGFFSKEETAEFCRGLTLMKSCLVGMSTLTADIDEEVALDSPTR